MDEYDGDHEVRSPSMHRAQEPAERELVVQLVEARPRFASRWDVHQRQQDTRHELQHQQRHGSTAKDVPPTCCISRHGMEGGILDWTLKLDSALEPIVGVL
jgi:hypothetical protein